MRIIYPQRGAANLRFVHNGSSAVARFARIYSTATATMHCDTCRNIYTRVCIILFHRLTADCTLLSIAHCVQSKI